MKNLSSLILTMTIFAGAAFAYPALPPAAINDIQGLQGINTHDMQLIRQQRFRHEEINEVKDLKEQKDKKNKELQEQEIQVSDPAVKRLFHRQKAKDINFVEENGKIKIEHSENFNN